MEKTSLTYNIYITSNFPHSALPKSLTFSAAATLTRDTHNVHFF